MTHAGPGTADPMFAVSGACANATEREMAQRFIAHARASGSACASALARLSSYRS